MRWQLTLQLASGLAILFLLAHVAAGLYVGPPAEALLHRAALADATATANEIAVEWQRMRTVQERLVRTAADSPILSSLGAFFPSGEGRQRALKSALDALVLESGSDGQAVLIGGRNTVLAGSGQGAPQLSQSGAVKDALDGGTSVRLEIIDGTLRVVSAAPVPSSGEVAGAIALSTALDSARLNVWSGRLPMGAAIVLMSGKNIVGTTLRAKKSPETISPDPAGMVEIEGEKYAVQTRDLVDDGGSVVRVLGVAKRDPQLLAGIEQRVQFMIVALGAFAILLTLAVSMMSSSAAAAEEGEAESDALESDPMLEPVSMSGSLGSSADDFGIGLDSLSPSPPTPLPRVPAPFTSISPPRSPPKLSFKPAEKPPTVPPSLSSSANRPASISSTSESSFSARPAPSPEPTGPPSPFDAIAAAAMTSAPPPAPPIKSAPTEPRVDSHEDLPMPVEHLQLPGLRAGEDQQPEPRRTPGASPGLSRSGRSIGSAPAGGGRKTPSPSPFQSKSSSAPSYPASDDPWRGGSAPSVPGMRQQQVSKSDDLPIRPSMPQAPPPGAARAYGGNSVGMSSAASAPASSSSREPLVAFDEEHYRLVYNEFVGSKARLGEAVDNITYEGFSSKLRSSERELIDRHGCRAVRFQVLVKDRQVSLRPQLVR